MNLKKSVFGIGIALLILSFFYFGGHRFFNLDFLRQSQAQFNAWYAASPWLISAAFLAIYVGITVLSLPGAAVMTLAAGASFGLVWGTVIVSVASTLGATGAMWLSRYVLRDAVQKRFGKRLEEIHRGIEKDGAFYLLSLRLLPIIPFFALNALMGLTKMRSWTFFWVSQIGMLPGTIAYVYAGTALASIQSLRDVLSPSILGALIALGLLPWLFKWILSIFQKRKIYAPWASQKPKQFDRNLIVIGAGAAGLVSSYIAAAVKAKVTLIEAHKMGGDCLNYGCVPSKALIASAKMAHLTKKSSEYGVEHAGAAIHFKAVMQRIQAVIERIEPHDSVQRYTEMGVECLAGHAKIINPWTVEITAQNQEKSLLTSRSIIIAAGAAPIVPNIPGIEQSGYLTSDTLWGKFAQLDAAPKRLLILGGGAIGCELAQSFVRLGSAVTLVEAAPRLLSQEDEEVSQYALQTLMQEGVQVLCGHLTIRFEANKTLIASPQNDSASQEIRIEFDEFICAAGRAARLTGYGLEELGIHAERSLPSNDYLETMVPNIFVAGDVSGSHQLTHAAAHQAWYATVNALFGRFKKFKVNDSIIPAVTFLDPEIARVGLNEKQAKTQGIEYEVTRFDLNELDRAITDGVAHGFVKILTPPGKDKILGACIVGAHAGELLAEYVLAMKHGLGLNKILATIHSYPTMAEANKYAAGQWKRAHQPVRLLNWVRKYHDWMRN